VTVAIPVNGQKRHKRLMWAIVKDLFSFPEALRQDELLYWRERILFAILAGGLALSLFVIVPAAIMTIKEEMWALAVIDILVYLCALSLLIFRSISYEIRASVTSLMTYALGLYILLSVGLLSGGPAWLFLFTVLAAVLLGLKAACAAITINAITLIIIGMAIRTGQFGGNYTFITTSEKLIVAAANFMLLNAVAAISVAVLVRGLQSAAQREKAATDSLKRERAQLIEAKGKLNREVDERKQAEELLKDSEQKYRTLVEESFDGIFVQKGPKIIFSNKVLHDMLGYDEGKLIGLDHWLVYHPDYQQITRERAQARMRGEMPPSQYEVKLQRKDGSWFYGDISARAISLAGEPGVQVWVKDITERKRAEEALRESEEKYRLLVENANDAIFILQDGFVKFHNKKTEDLIGYPGEELCKIPFANFYHHEDKNMALERRRRREKGETPPNTYPVRIIKKSGEELWIELSTALIKWQERPATINFFRDITRQKKLEAQLQRAQKMEAIGTLAGGVAHDLNNILSGLVSYPELILMDLSEDSALKNPILTIKKSGEKAAAIVQDLLTLARRGVAVTEVVNLNNIISEYLKSPEFDRLKFYHPNVQVETDLDKKLLNISGSPVHISKAIMNLVSNAAEAMPYGGKISISAKNQYIDKPIRGYDEVAEGDYVVFSISDTGVGISPEDMERIFEPFYTKKVMGRSGTGLGMAVVWGTIKDHKGYIDVKSTEEKGTTFTLYFPVTIGEAVREKSSISIEDYMGKGESILIVDDVEEQREIASGMLKKLGYSISAFSSGEEAVEYMKDKSVDLLLLDMIMDPGIDGLETYKRILEFHPNQKAIIASGFSETDRVKEAQRLGAGAYVKKPYVLENIGIAVRNELDLL
jgi:PAS domain S-box-containing protein